MPSNIPEGANIPDFKLQSLSGETVRPSDYLGKRLVIFFWASW
jgi:peroxiredoxin